MCIDREVSSGKIGDESDEVDGVCGENRRTLTNRGGIYTHDKKGTRKGRPHFRWLDCIRTHKKAEVEDQDWRTIDGSTARRCTAIVTNERRARLRHSVKFLVRVARLKNVQSSADITAK